MGTVLPAIGLATSASTAATGTATAEMRVLADWSEFDGIRPQWDQLHRHVGGGLFSTSGWLAAWRAQQAALGVGIQEPRIVTLWRDGFLVAAAPLGVGPLALSKYLPGLRPPAVQILGAEMAGYTEWLARSPEDADALACEIARLGRRGWLRLDIVRVGGPLGDPAVWLSGHLPGMRTLARFNCTTIDLRGGFEAYMDDRPREFRKLVRVSERRASEAGAVYLSEKDCGEAILDRVIKVSQRGWKGQAGTGIGASASNLVYLRALWREFSPTDDFHVLVLLLDGQEAAHIITIDCNGVAYGLACDFDETHAHCSPGRLVTLAGIREATARGIGCYDMLRRTHYLERFSDDYYQTVRLVGFPRRNGAWFAFSAEAAARRLLGGLKSSKRKRARRIDFITSPGNGGEA